MTDPDPLCPLCLRPIPPDVPQSLHHLIPKLKRGNWLRRKHKRDFLAKIAV